MREEDSLSSRKKAIRNMIEAAFGREDAPNASSIVDSVCPEPLQIREYFSGRSWWVLTLKGFHDDYVGDSSACLTFMTPLGIDYYLPAYLLMATERYEEGDVLTQSLAYRLSLYISKDATYRLSLLSVEKQKAIASVLQFLWDEYEDEGAAEAIEIFWGKFLEN
ncbi:DUF6714 family protein [Pseudomonas oryziphila]|uniref:Uncharacterized protein n=1 Tax=Pseudomonas entomophila TaxID=312306 RepID=A0A3Q8U1T4_9PSED|nr:DUF6714 family protein [Pseudomonas oryziphila]AZL69161.1 hypothetical protein EJA05_16140 [Pseudomonas oryziphila]